MVFLWFLLPSLPTLSQARRRLADGLGDQLFHQLPQLDFARLLEVVVFTEPLGGGSLTLTRGRY